ncbi:MAG: hypothetical protein RJQ01_06360 [Microcella sp.]|uniref:sensor histidine kinase n=1 Tax=Microcella sp. TaxID=1913979 RepID=UPI00331484D6
MAVFETPRPVAAAAIVHGLAAAQRVIVLIGLLFGALTVADLLVARGHGGYATLVVAPVLAVSLLALVLLWRPTLVTASLFLAGGAVCSVAVITLGLTVDPEFADPGPFALNRTATALVLVGALHGSAVSGMVWSTAGLVVAYGSLAIGLASGGGDAQPGWGPLLLFIVSFLAYAILAFAQRRARLAAPALENALVSLERAERRRALELRSAAVVHDTVLADLAVIATSPGPLSDRARARFDSDVDLIRSSSVRDPNASQPVSTEFGAALLDLARDFQWTGVRVEVSGAEMLSRGVDPRVADALLAAARAALDNVARHSGADHADLVVGERSGVVSLLIVDDGHGFDPDAVPGDRLGLSTAIKARVEDVGGSVRIWAGEDGTTVMLSAPWPGVAP